MCTCKCIVLLTIIGEHTGIAFFHFLLINGRRRGAHECDDAIYLLPRVLGNTCKNILVQSILRHVRFTVHDGYLRYRRSSRGYARALHDVVSNNLFTLSPLVSVHASVGDKVAQMVISP